MFTINSYLCLSVLASINVTSLCGSKSQTDKPTASYQLYFDTIKLKIKYRNNITLGGNLGSVSYSSSDNNTLNSQNTGSKNTSTTTAIGFGPQIGFNLSPNLVLGGNLNLSFSKNKNNTFTQANSFNEVFQFNSFTISAGPYLRFYFTNSENRNRFYGQINAAVGTGSGDNKSITNSTTEQSTSTGNTKTLLSLNYGAGIGIVHSLRGKVGIDFSLGYSHNYNNGTSSNANSSATIIQGRTNTNSNNSSSRSVFNTNGVYASIGLIFYQ